MFWNLVANENVKNLKRAMFWIELALLVVFVILIFFGIFSVIKMNIGGEAAALEARSMLEKTVTWPDSLITTLNFVTGNALGGLLLVILVGAVTAQEYTWRTLHLWLSHGIPRPALIGAKFLSLLLPGLLIVLVTLVAGGLVSALTSFLIYGRLPLDQVNFVQLGLSVLRTAYTLLPYAALAFLLAIASRSVVAAIGGALAYTLLIEGFVVQLLMVAGGSLARLMQYLPSGLANSLLMLNSGISNLVGSSTAATKSPVPLLDPIQAAIGIALWTLLFTGLALWIFQRQDLSE
jgi:ABC-type transport system involved in multi-copper enzyme maturation permease subunit